MELDKTLRKIDSTLFHHNDPIRLVNNAFALCFKEAHLSTTLGSDIETNKFCGQVSTIMRVISNKDGDLLSQFDNINEYDIPVLEKLTDFPPQVRSTPHEKMLLNNHTDANKGKIKGYLYLEDFFGFCKGFKNVTKILGLHLVLKTADLQDIENTSMTDDLFVTFNNLYLFIPNIVLSVEFQLKFNEATQKNYEIYYDQYLTEKRIVTDLLVQHVIVTAQ